MSILDDASFRKLKYNIERLIGLFLSKVIDTSRRYHLIEVLVTLQYFSQEDKGIMLEIKYTDKRMNHWTVDDLLVNVEAFAHNSQNMTPRFLKMIRDSLNKELGVSNRNYNNYSDFLIDGLPSKEIWQDAGLYQYNLSTVQELKRLFVVLMLKKTVFVYSLIGQKYEQTIASTLPLSLLNDYFKEKCYLTKSNLRSVVVEIEEHNEEEHYSYTAQFYPVEPRSASSRFSHNLVYSPDSSPRSIGRLPRSNNKRKMFVLTNQSLRSLITKEKRNLLSLKSKVQISDFLGWQDFLGEDKLENRTDKVVVRARPLEILNVKHEGDFYQCVLEFCIQQTSIEQMHQRASKQFILSDFALSYTIQTRNRETLYSRVISYEAIPGFLQLTEGQALAYCMSRVTKSVSKLGERQTIWKILTAFARKHLLW